MPFPVSSGAANYTGNFIPELWAAKLIQNFYDATVFGEIANTDYEGEIKSFGDKVQIRTTPEMTIRSYSKGQNLTLDRPDKARITLNIDQGEYFAAIEDDVDKVQADINLLDAWSKDASERMKIKIDTNLLSSVYADVAAANTGNTAGRISGNIALGASGSPVQVTKMNILDYIVDMGVVLDEQNVPESGRWLVMPAWMCGLIKKSDLKDASMTGDGQSILRNGRIGSIERFTIYMSNNVAKVTDGSYTCYNVMAGHKIGLTFAAQMTEMETLRAESTFGNIIRGLQVYGFKTVKGEALARLYARP